MDKQSRLYSIAKRALSVLALIALVGACYWLFGSQLKALLGTSCSDVQSRFLAYGAWAPVILFGGFLASTLAIIPGTILTMFAGLSFGLFWGTLLATAGNTAAATLAFFLMRTIARRPIESLLQNRPWFIKLQTHMRTQGLESIIVLRLIPIFPFTGLNFACGLMPIRAKDYILGSFLGMIPGTFVYAYIGRTSCRLMDLIMQKNIQISDIPVEMRWELGTAALLLAALSLIPILRRLWIRPEQRRGD